MRLSDAIRAKRSDILDRAEALAKKASDESRLFTADEDAAFRAATDEVKSLDKQLETQLAAEAMVRGGQGQRIAVDDAGGRHLILRSTGKLADRVPSRGGERLDLAKTIRGIVTSNWDNADAEKRAMSVGSLPGGGYAVPAELSATWIDMARSKAVCIAAGAGTIVMDSMNLRIASIVGDVAPAFRPENVALPENDVTFGALDLKAKLIGVVCRASLELISDSPNAADMITASITGALGVAMDAAMLSGDGLVDATHDNPRGILNWPGVNAVTTVGAPTSYDKWLDAINLIEVANLAPNAVIDHPNTANGLRKLRTGISVTDMSSLVPPAAYSALTPFVTTGLAAGNSIVGDFAHALLGMREGIVIEATRVGSDALSKAQILIRGYMRLDTGLTHAKAFSKLTGVAALGAEAETARAAR